MLRVSCFRLQRFGRNRPAQGATQLRPNSVAPVSRFSTKIDTPKTKFEVPPPIATEEPKEDAAADSKKPEDEDDDDGDILEFVNPKTGEIGGPRGPEPTRYGDWEKKGRVSDF